MPFSDLIRAAARHLGERLLMLPNPDLPVVYGRDVGIPDGPCDRFSPDTYDRCYTCHYGADDHGPTVDWSSMPSLLSGHQVPAGWAQAVVEGLPEER
jgi:hypothetical protein